MAQLKIVSKAKFDRRLVMKFNTRYILTHSFFMYFISLLGIYALITLLTSKNLNKEEFSYVLSWSIAIIGILFVPLYLFFSVTRATKKEQKENGDVIDTFEITKEKILKSDSKNTDKIVLNWNLISKVLETKETFYFTTVNDACFQIPKNTIVEGNIESLRTLINKCLTPKKNGKIPFKSKDKEYNELLKMHKNKEGK